MNKNLQVLKLDENSVSSIIFKQIKYLPCLSSIELEGVPRIEEYNRCFFVSKFSLKSVTFISPIRPNKMAKHNEFSENDMQFLRMILELPNFQKINFSSEFPDRITINDIPFNIIRKRNISFFIHISQKSAELSPSTPNKLGLENLEFLGLRFNESYSMSEPSWDICYEDYLKTLQGCQRKLFLNLHYPKLFGLSDLILACKNIITLQILISDHYIKRKIDFSSLKYLANLRNLFIEFWDTTGISDAGLKDTTTNDHLGLFKSLTWCAGTLKSISIHFYSEYIKEKEDDIFGFFEACADSLTQITLRLNLGLKSDPLNIEIFYKGLKILNRVESIKIAVNQLSGRSKKIKNLLSNKRFLREFYLSAPFADAKDLFINFGKLKDVSKLSLEMRSSEPDYELFHKSNNFSNLRYFELAIGLPDLLLWRMIVKILNRIGTLEVLIVLWNEYEDEEKKLKLSFETLFKSLSNLKFIAMGNEKYSSDIRIFLRKCSSPLPSVQDIDNFYGRWITKLPERRNQKICLLLDA